jgi:hypothetical protein
LHCLLFHDVFVLLDRGYSSEQLASQASRPVCEAARHPLWPGLRTAHLCVDMVHGEPQPPNTGSCSALLGLGEQPHLDCPICMSLLTDPFVTPCGHTFCFGCITTHLQTGKNCPSCQHYLTKDLIYPNFLLSKVWLEQGSRGTRCSCLLHLAQPNHCSR